jgi:hypothetical protein
MAPVCDGKSRAIPLSPTEKPPFCSTGKPLDRNQENGAFGPI